MLNLRNFLPLLLLGALAGCRQDMHNQPRFKPLAESDFYSDLRSARPPVDGTVPRGELRADTYFYSGMLPGTNTPGDYLPFPVTKQALERGRERFNVYCSPCHSRLGDGNGIVPSRGFARKPPSFHIERLRKVPLGYFFDVMTHGFGLMADYAAQITPEDRWKIAAYIRALQVSQSAPVADIPPGQQIPSPPPAFRGDPPSGGSLPEMDVPAPQETK
jgi:mono/diheme cytochrome c family protein